MKKEVIGFCPICDHDLIVTKMSCTNCKTEITGEFYLSKFNYLTTDQLYFIEMFIKNQGSIKAIEKEMNISYPTVKKMLNDVIKKLGYETEEDDDPEQDLKRQEILAKLEKKQITPEEATKLLQKL